MWINRCVPALPGSGRGKVECAVGRERRKTSGLAGLSGMIRAARPCSPFPPNRVERGRVHDTTMKRHPRRLKPGGCSVVRALRPAGATRPTDQAPQITFIPVPLCWETDPVTCVPVEEPFACRFPGSGLQIGLGGPVRRIPGPQHSPGQGRQMGMLSVPNTPGSTLRRHIVRTY
jgi:hypothetical protein